MRDSKMYNPRHAKSCYLANVKYIGTCERLCYFEIWDESSLSLPSRKVSARAIKMRVLEHYNAMRDAEKSHISEMIKEN